MVIFFLQRDALMAKAQHTVNIPQTNRANLYLIELHISIT